MTEEPSDRVQALFDRAADLTGAEREAFLDAACQGDPGLRAEVEELLRYADRTSEDTDRSDFLHSPFVRLAENTPSYGKQPAESHQFPAIPGYEIEGTLGRGGMGVVYRARDLALRRTVALKVILAAGKAGGPDRQRFQVEAEAVARLQHPNIVQIHAVGEHDGRLYCALEFVEGCSLAQRLDAGSLHSPQAAALVETLARAVELAHQRHIVHRDLKPANVLLAGKSEQGTGNKAEGSDLFPKIVDFGLARRLDVEGHPTQAGVVMGTPSYMAPEQARGEAVGPACDIYALGAILYECLTGRPPFKGSSEIETLDLVRRQEPVAPRWLNAGVPRDLETICLKCLEKEPHRRYASAEALADDLRRWRAGEPIAARPVGALGRAAKWARRNPAVALLLTAVLVSLLLGTSVATFFALRAAQSAAEAQSKADEAEKQAARADQQARANEELAIKERAASMDAQAKGKLAEQNAQAAGFAAARAGNALHANQLRRALRAWLDHDLGAAEGALAEIEAPFQEALETRFLRQLWHRRVRSFPATGPTNVSVYDLAASADGKRLFLAKGWVPRSGEVEVRDAETGKVQFAFKRHDHWVRCLALTGDGTRAVSGSHDRTVKVWDTRTGAEQFTFRGHAGGIAAVAISRDGRWVVSADSNCVVKLWEASTGKEKLSFVAHPTGWPSVAIRGDGKQIVTAGGDGSHPNEIKVWDAESGAERFCLRGHTSPIRRIALSSDDRRLVSGDEAGVVRVWDMGTGKELFALKGHTGQVRVVAVSGDGKRFASGGVDGSIKVWDGVTGKEQMSLRGRKMVWQLAISGDGRQVISASTGGDIEIWNLDASLERLTVPMPGGPGAVPAVCVAVTPDGKRVASAFGGGKVALTVWDRATGREKFTRVAGNISGVLRVGISDDGRCVVTGGMDGIVKVWDGDTGAERFTLGGHQQQISAVAVSRDGRRVCSASLDGTVKVWDAETGKELRTLRGGETGVYSLAVSGDGKWLVSGDGAGIITIWDAETGERKATLQGHKEAILCLAISRDDRWFVSGSPSELKIWDVETGQVKRAMKGMAVTVAISADGKRIISGGSAGLTFWDVETGLEKLTFPVPPGGVMAVALSDDEGLITGGWDATAKVWDTRLGPENLTP
jgi:WD40 repeat protein/serine/threonine protein kinase